MHNECQRKEYKDQTIRDLLSVVLTLSKLIYVWEFHFQSEENTDELFYVKFLDTVPGTV